MLTLSNNLEYFQDGDTNRCNGLLNANLSTLKFYGTEFEDCFRKSWIATEGESSISPDFSIISEGSSFNYKSYESYKNNNMLGCIFCKKTDDIIAFEGYRLKRYQFRPDRNLDDFYQPKFHMSFRELETIEDKNLNLFVDCIKYLKEEYPTPFDDIFNFDINFSASEIFPHKDITESELFFIQNIKNPLSSKINVDDNIEMIKDRKKFNYVEIVLEKKETINSLINNEDKKEVKKRFTKYSEILDTLTDIFYKFNNNYNKCHTVNNKCLIDYQREMPGFYIHNDIDKPGISFMEYTNVNQPNVNSMGVNTNINPDKNEFKRSEFKGTFGNESLPDKFKYGDIGFVPDANEDLNKGYVKYENKLFFKLPNELVNIGVGMEQSSFVSDLVLIPDPTNNRIQVFKSESENFIYVTQFGNLENTVKRSLPTFEGHYSNNIYLKHTDFMYEPLVNMLNEASGNNTGITSGSNSGDTSRSSLFTKEISNYDCTNNTQDSDSHLNHLIKTNLNNMNNYCKNEFRRQHLDVHSINVLKNSQNKNKLGHFNYLRAEFGRVTNYEVLEKDFNYDNFHHPNYIGFKNIGSKIESNAITEATYLFRQVLYKNIKVTHLGNQFGQLFRPKSIALDKDDSKYYVVDTFHHCIQCFDKYSYECPDLGKDKPSNKLYQYEMDCDFVPQPTTNIHLYNDSNLYSLGSRLLVLKYSENENEHRCQNSNPATDTSYKNLINTQEGKIWQERYGQNIKDDSNRQTVYLTRWVSKQTKYANIENVTDYQSIAEPQFFSQDLGGSGSSGCGEFLYPSDIVIFNEKKLRDRDTGKEFQFLMVTDMGNNRVSIFRKRVIIANNERRFRFYRFLDETAGNIKTPLSITVNENLGKVYVLNGQKELDGRKILVYFPELDSGNIKYKLIYKLKASSNATKIRIDDRGFIVVSENNEARITILKDEYSKREYINEAYSDISDTMNEDNSKTKIKQKFTFEEPIVRLNSVYFNLKITPDKNEDLKLLTDDINRFRIVLQRNNESLRHKHYEYIMSPEFKYDYKFNVSDGKIDLDNMLTKYTIVDSINNLDYENHWYSYQLGEINKLDVDFINFDKTKTDYENYVPDILVSNDRKNLRVKKRYTTPKFYNGNKNILLENYEDWYGMGLLPNTTYKYKFGIYNYLNIEYKKDEDQPFNKIEKKIHTLSLNVNSDNYIRNYNAEQNKFEFECEYANQGDIYRLTQEFNPLYINVYRLQHNRTKDVLTKYITLGKNQFIQLILPSKSKYIFNKNSKPKFGNLYVYNIYDSGSVETQGNNSKGILMEEDKIYDLEKYIIFYAANGQNIDQLNVLGTEYGIDYFTVGDNPSTIQNKVKFMVYIDLNQDFKNKEEVDKIIQFNKEDKIEGFLKKNYVKPEDDEGIYSVRKILKKPLLEIIESSDGVSKVEYPEKVKFEDNQIENNKTYEYLMLIGNQDSINPAANSFYMTSPPFKPYLLPVKDERLGPAKDNYLRIEWFTPKNTNIYWSYNFLLLRRIKKNKDIKPKIGNSKGRIGNMENIEEFNFNDNQKKIQLKSGINKKTYIHEFINKDDTKSWKIYFNIINSQRTTFNFEVFVNGKNNKGKQTYDSNKANKSLELFLKDTVYFAKTITLKVHMEEGDTLDNIRIRETVPKVEDNEVVDQDNDAMVQEKIRIQNNLQKYKKEVIDNNYKVLEFERIEKQENKKKLKEIREKIAEERSIGKFFYLEDDFEQGEDNHFRGYTGDLYFYLKDKKLSDLHKIFDTLHEKILVYHGDITMRFDGPAGMLKSGGKDLIIDKIRYMALILRKGYEDTLEKLGVKCIRNKGLSGGKTCVATSYLEKIEVSKRKLQMKKNELKNNIFKNEEKKQNLQEEILKKRAIKNRIAAQKDDILQIEKEINDLEKKNSDLELELEDKNKIIINVENGIPDASTNLRLELFCPTQTDETKCVIPDLDLAKKKLLTEFKNEFSTLEISTEIEDIRICKGYTGMTTFLFKDFGTNSIEGRDLRDNLNVLNIMNGGNEDKNVHKRMKEMYPKITHIIYQKDKKGTFKFIEESNGFDESYVVPGEEEENNMIIIAKKSGSTKQSITRIEKAKESNIKEITRLKSQIKTLKVENDENPDIQAYNELLQNYEKADSENLELSDWFVLKHGLTPQQIPKYPTEKEVKDIIEVYGIHPTLHKLSGATRFGTHFFNDEQKTEMIENNKSNYEMLERTEFISNKQMIPLGDKTPQLYQYCIVTYQTGYSFDSNNKRIFMGTRHLTVWNNQQLDLKGTKFSSFEFNFPNFNLGETYSNIVEKGEEVVNTVQKQSFIPPPLLNIKSVNKPTPVIKLFKPKQGIQGSIVRIIGSNLDKIKYFCFRDVKVEVVRKGHTLIKEIIDGKEQNSKYEEYLVKVPTLKQLGKVCWQSLRPYEVLVWGYYEKEGKQIRSSENQESDNTSIVKKSIMFRYMDRTECPENEKLDFPK